MPHPVQQVIAEGQHPAEQKKLDQAGRQDPGGRRVGVRPAGEGVEPVHEGHDAERQHHARDPVEDRQDGRDLGAVDLEMGRQGPVPGSAFACDH
jgi:hypothetical protein